ncbi:MAG: SusC/RagA family TonB-linked outer membrane protein, partial [Saprospiraceae bacterium]|nr:SusC/RagA family TonB-linked outer membrane protein [Saprospiraceae bacterium]
MKKLFTIFSLTLAFVCLVSLSYAQRTVTGTVTDAESGYGLIGANVLIQGTSSGTITDIDGNYSVDGVDDATVLVFSYTGYGDQEVLVGTQSVIDVVMSAGELLEEVVVIGYGTVKKSDATGAVTGVSEKDFNKGVIASPEQLIQGRAAGVQITSSSGEPGAGMNIRIRGTSSVRSGNNPLFVVDGVPLSGEATGAGVSGEAFSDGQIGTRNPLNFMNPNDIASIDILKDASATAIYGSRGANGVVLITTKRGKFGQGLLSYDYSLGISTISKKYDLLGKDAFLDAYQDFNSVAARNALDGGANTDWQEEIFQQGISHNHNVSYGGGDELSDYRFSFSYADQEGIVLKSGLERYTARFNANRKFIDEKLQLSTQVTIATTEDNNVAITNNSGFAGDLLGAALKANPSAPVYNDDGTFRQIGQDEPNPVAISALSDDFTNTLRALGSLSAEYKITDNLSFKTVLGFDRSISERRAAFSRDLVAQGIVDKGRAYFNDIEIDNKLWENYFTYNKELSDNIDLTGLLGYSYQSFDIASSSIEMTNFRTSDLDLMVNNTASVDLSQPNSIVPTNSSRSFDEIQSFFGRVNVSVQSKYLITATLRSDGSTRFGEGNQYGYFPSFAMKWRLIEEDWVPEVFADLGLRLGWGVTGNQEIPHNVFQERQRYDDYDINNSGNTDGGGLGSVAFANPDLKWETTSQINLGIDFGFLDYRLTGSLDVYKKNTDDLLIKINSAQPAVSPFVWSNLPADIENIGLELGLNGVVADRDNFGWNVIANVAYNKNEVKDFSGLINTGDIDGQGLTGAFAQRIAQGQPLFAYFLRDFAGFDDNGISVYNDGDFQQFVGASPLPTWTAGLTNSF